MTTIEPGWYRDPVDQSVQRYWDGEGWIGEPIAADATPPAIPPSPSEPAKPAEPQRHAPVQPAQPYGAATPPPGTQPPASPPQGNHPQGTQQGYPQGNHPQGTQQGYPQGTPPGYPPGHPIQPGQPLPRYQSFGQFQAMAVQRRAMARNLRPHGYPLAGLWARFWARVIDMLIGLCLNALVNGWFVWQYWREIKPSVDAYLNGDTEALTHTSSRAGWLTITILLIATALWFAYEVPSVANTGQTLGKRAMQIRVVGVESAEPLGLRRAWMRWRLMGLPTMLWTFCFVGFLLQALDILRGLVDQPLHQSAHDRSAGTIVVTVGPRNGQPQTNSTDETGIR